MKPLSALLQAASLRGCAANACAVEGMTCRSEEAGRGDIFVALRGHTLDGHDYAMHAYRRGTRLFLCERRIELPKDATLILSENVRKSAAEMMSCLYDAPQKRMTIAGITGTKGKTTTAHFLYRLLRSRRISAALVGTMGLLFDGDRIPTANTTPDIFFLYPHMARLCERGCTHLVLEISSQALADGRIDTLPIEVAAFTSFGRDHIGEREHASMDDYLRAKRRLFYDFSPAYTVVNADDPVTSRMPYGTRGGVRCSLCGAGDVSAEVLGVGTERTEYRFAGERLSLALMGRHFVMNALIAAACAQTLTDGTMEELLPLLSEVRVPGRSEYLLRAGRHILIDYAHNAMSLRSVAEMCRAVYGGRLLAVFGSVGGRAQARRVELAQAADELFELSILTADTSDEEQTAVICEQMRRHFSHPLRARVEPCRERAIRLAFSLSRAGDTLLLLGMGDEVHADGVSTDRAVVETLA